MPLSSAEQTDVVESSIRYLHSGTLIRVFEYTTAVSHFGLIVLQSGVSSEHRKQYRTHPVTLSSSISMMRSVEVASGVRGTMAG